MSGQNPASVVLVSGGMDSCVTLALALQETNPHLMHVHYGQRTQEREARAFHEVASHFGIPASRRLLVDIGHLAAIGGSSLTDTSEQVEDGNLDAEGVPRTYVPFRNGNLIAMAASWAEVLKATSIWLGVVEEDSSGYPDCRAGFIKAMELSIKLGTAETHSIEIRTPLVHMRKQEIVQKGLDLKAPLHLTWSCYQGVERACGRCDSCLLRLKAFREAGSQDQIRYDE